MVITSMEQLEHTKIKVFKVYIDNEYAFLLYSKDIKRFHLEEGTIISSECYEEIVEDTVYRRAKQKALAILKFLDRTEQELRRKLLDAGYSQMIIDRTISYVYDYDYLNDERFAASYVRAKMNTKSKLIIKSELLQKGIKKELINNIFEIEYGDDNSEDAELNAIRKAIAKKTKFPENLTLEEKQKIMASLYRKGFEISKIKQILF